MAEFANGATWGFDSTETISGTPTYVDVGEIVNINLDGPTADTLDVSVHDDAWRRFVGGLANAGTASMEVRFTTGNATHASIMNLIGRSSPFAQRIRGPEIAGETRWEFTCDGFITSAAPSFPHDGLATMSVQVQFSGEPNLPA